MRKPFYFRQKACWYVKDKKGRAIRLDPNEETAFRMWQTMRAAAEASSHPDIVTIAAIAQAWLDEHQPSLSETRFYAVGNYLGRFVDGIGASTKAKDVTPGAVLRWASTQEKPNKEKAKPWSAWAKHDAMSVVKRVYAWAHNQGYLQRHYLYALKLSKPRGRKRTITDGEHRMLVDAARAQKQNGPQFATYLIASHCGARPQQIREVKAENIHPSGACWVFTEHKTDESGKPLVVYLNPCLQTLTKILAAANPDGRLFRQEDGKPWPKDTVTMRLRRLRKRLGLSDDIVAYCYRHTYATDALRSGVPIATVAALLGHTDTRMVSQVYGHLDQHAEHLSEAAAQAQRKRLG